jgi:hypothetical protein
MPCDWLSLYILHYPFFYLITIIISMKIPLCNHYRLQFEAIYFSSILDHYFQHGLKLQVFASKLFDMV